MSNKNIVGLILLSFYLWSCGLQPIYQTSQKLTNKDYDYRQDLATISVKVDRKKLNQDLKNHLEKVLNPNEIKVDAKYLLTVTLQKSITSTFTNYTGSSGRNKVILTANYRLQDLNNNQIISTGTTNVSNDFNVESKKFANYTAEDSIATNLTVIIAKNIRDLLINDIINNHKTKSIDEGALLKDR